MTQAQQRAACSFSSSHLRVIAVALLAFASCGPGHAPPPRGQSPIGLEHLTRLDLLPVYRNSTKIGAFSSYDRTGGNDDGFLGTYSFLRKQDDGGLVVAEVEGPGAIYRIWTPTPDPQIWEFYFDGEADPRISIDFPDLFNGARPPFVEPLVGSGAGGYYCYLPILFEKSIKIVARTEKLRFYQINYAQYAPDAGIRTFDHYRSPDDVERLEQAREVLALAGSDLSSRVTLDPEQVHTTRGKLRLPAEDPQTLFESTVGGRIVGIRMSPASRIADPARSLIFQAYWDGDAEPAILAPIGDFFGASWGEPAAQSLLFGVADDTFYSYFPMPFGRSARLELVSQQTDSPAVDIEFEVLWSPQPRGPDEGGFYAYWRRENPTGEGYPFTFLSTSGRGHVVGAVLQAQGYEPASTSFFEGDDRTDIDGELAVHGTGSEDFFNGGWYNVIGRWMSRVSLPLSGCLDYKNQLSRTGGYRLLLGDAYPFQKHISLTIEHAPTENSLLTDYVGLTFFYAESHPPHSFAIPGPAERRAAAPRQIVYRPGWHLPIDAFSIQNMSIEKRQEPIAGKPTRYLRVRAQGEDRFGLHSISFRCDAPEAARYRLSIEAVNGPDQGVVQIAETGKLIGKAVDLYAPSRELGQEVEMVELDLVRGENILLFHLTGKNERSSGLGFDLARIILDRL